MNCRRVKEESASLEDKREGNEQPQRV